MKHITSSSPFVKKNVAVIGGGPAGLMAAEVIALAGHHVSIYDAMPSVGRKFLLAGVGGMNITHAEPQADFLARYFSGPLINRAINEFDSNQLRNWIHELGIKTFVGTSGRVFPTDMKAASLLRAWLQRLRQIGIVICPRHRWVGWADQREGVQHQSLMFNTLENGVVINKVVHADAVVLALGGASWQRLGSDGAWVNLLGARGIHVNELVPSNCGFDVCWSDLLRTQFAGVPLQGVGLSCSDLQGREISIKSEAIITTYGIEGTGIYALSRYLRAQLTQQGFAELVIDLLPDLTLEKIAARLNKPKGKASFSNFLRKQLQLAPVKIALLREFMSKNNNENPHALAQALKNITLHLTSMRPIDEAISSAGGIVENELDEKFMLKKLPGVFCAGEMLDWDAPTGGYLLTGCFATGRAAGGGVLKWLNSPAAPEHNND